MIENRGWNNKKQSYDDIKDIQINYSCWLFIILHAFLINIKVQSIQVELMHPFDGC